MHFGMLKKPDVPPPPCPFGPFVTEYAHASFFNATYMLGKMQGGCTQKQMIRFKKQMIRINLYWFYVFVGKTGNCLGGCIIHRFFQGVPIKNQGNIQP